MDPLLARVERPDDAEHQGNRNVVAEIATDQLAGRRLAASFLIHNLRPNRHLAGRRLAVDPEEQNCDRREQPVDEEVGRAGDESARAKPVFAAVEESHERRADDQHQDRVDNGGTDAGPEADVFRFDGLH